MKVHFSKIKLTILHLQKVTDQVLHEAILLCHIPLEVHHLGEHILVIAFQVAYVGGHVILGLDKTLNLRLQGLNGY